MDPIYNHMISSIVFAFIKDKIHSNNIRACHMARDVYSVGEKSGTQ